MSQLSHVTFMNQLLNHVFRIATNPRQFIKRGSYVLFKFFVDGEALSEVTKNAQRIAKLFQLSIILLAVNYEGW